MRGMHIVPSFHHGWMNNRLHWFAGTNKHRTKRPHSITTLEPGGEQNVPTLKEIARRLSENERPPHRPPILPRFADATYLVHINFSCKVAEIAALVPKWHIKGSRRTTATESEGKAGTLELRWALPLFPKVCPLR